MTDVDDREGGSSGGGSSKARRGRGVAKTFPTISLRDASVLARAIAEHSLDRRIRRTTLFERLKRSPESGASRQLIINAGRYGLAVGGYSAEYLQLTEAGRALADETTPARELMQARFDRSIAAFEPFNRLYERLKDKRLPASDIVQDQLVQNGLARADAATAHEVFMENIRDAGLITDSVGGERVMPLEEALEKVGTAAIRESEKPTRLLVLPSHEAGRSSRRGGRTRGRYNTSGCCRRFISTCKSTSMPTQAPTKSIRFLRAWRDI